MALKKGQNNKFKLKINLIHQLRCLDKVFWQKYYSFDEFDILLSGLTNLQYDSKALQSFFVMV